MTIHRTGAGGLDRRIVIQRFTTTTDTFNAEVKTWADYITVSAKRMDLADTERRMVAFETSKAGQVGSYMISRFKVRSSSLTRTITAQDRMTHDGAIWSIKGPPYETLDGRQRFLWITAVRETDISMDATAAASFLWATPPDNAAIWGSGNIIKWS